MVAALALASLAVLAGSLARAWDRPRAGSNGAAPAAGVLVMAHGGDAAWNEAVAEAVRPLRATLAAEIAFGMADPETIQAAVERLEAKDVRRIAVVRLFISGDSFKDRTEKILGLRPGAPPRPAPRPSRRHPADDPEGHGGPGAGGHGRHDPDSMPLWRVESRSEFSFSGRGLMDGDGLAELLARRAADLSREPAEESVVLIGHGPADDAENARWLSRMDRLADGIRALGARAGRRGFRSVRVETLREDWPAKRKEAEARIRGFVREAGAGGGRALVIAFRLSGFGPYAEVLEGLDYASDGKGLLPHPAVGDWIRDEARSSLLAAGWPDPWDPAGR